MDVSNLTSHAFFRDKTTIQLIEITNAKANCSEHYPEKYR